MEWFDAHCHYTDEKFGKDREEVIQRVYQQGITKMVSAGYDTKATQDSLQLGEKYFYIYTTAGISPNDVKETWVETNLEIQKIAQMVEKEKQKQGSKLVAIGEIGLDYYWNQENKEIQQKAFIAQIQIANQHELPIVIHTREAVMDTITVLKENPVFKKGIFHCCPMNRELVKEALKLDFMISLAGPITFKNAKNANEIIEMVPLSHLLVETDSPYLAPEPHRGTRNDSGNICYIGEKIAKVKGIEIEEVAKATYENAQRIYQLEKEIK